MASIKPHGDRWRAFVCVAGTRRTRVLRTKREAIAWASAAEAALHDSAETPAAVRYTFGDALDQYVRDVSPGKRGRRWEEVRIAAFRSMPALPVGLPVGQVTTAHLAAWRDDRLRAVSAGTVLREIALLSAVFEVARKEWGWIPTNPVRDLGKPRRPEHRETVISRRQARAILRELGHQRGPCKSAAQAVARAFLLALRTGMRAGELCGLTWDRVHADHAELRVTKTRPRRVPLEPRARRLVETMRGWDELLVFGIKAQTLDALFRRHRDRAGIVGVRFHDTRHTAATRMAQKLHVLDLCRVFGWSNPAQAMTYYNPAPGEIARRMG